MMRRIPSVALGYRPALDGLRAVAVIPVVVFHSTYTRVLPGGANGVDLFFVLSGFLITTLLLEEHEETGRVAIGSFYTRRLLRLGPALLLLLAASGLFSLTPLRGGTGSPAEVGRFTLYVLTYSANWVLALQSMAAPALLGHLWSLSVEEQFYFLWPLVLALLLRWHVRPTRLALALLVSIAALALWRAILWHLTHDVHRALFGTDCRANGLLFGAAVALWRRSDMRLSERVAILAALSGLVLYCTMSVRANQPAHSWLLGLKTVELASGLMLLGLTAGPPARWHAALSWKPLVWIGRRSYGIYLWHVAGLWIGVQLFRSRPFAMLAGVTITLAIVIVSYSLVERPALRLKRRFERVRPAREDDPPQGAVAA